MNYPALNANRQVVFNPCVCPGDRITHEVGNAASELLGLAHGNPRGDGIKLIRAAMGDAYQMLEQVGARFDLIVSAPPAGTMSSKGLPKPPVAKDKISKPAGRKLFIGGAAEAPAPEIDIGYATWLVTNALLSPFGEALLVVPRESYSLISKCPYFLRVWRMDRGGEPGELGRYAVGRDKLILYVARDHNPRPGEFPAREGLFRSAIRGVTLIPETLTPDSAKKFYTVRDEYIKRGHSASNDYNILLDGGKVRLKFTEFQLMSGALPRELADEAEILRNKTLMELAVMRDMRDRAKKILADKRLKVSEGLVKAFDDVCKQMAILAAPFTRPSPVQRVAWLDEQNTIECVRDFGPFVAGESYAVSTRTITGRKLEKRHRPGHKDAEEVLVTGQEVAIFVRPANSKWEHVFTQFPITEQMSDMYQNYVAPGAAHSLTELIVNFKMPEVADIAEADPAGYIKYRKRLEALQT